jgi:polysaccharide biosynthesis protein PslA
MLDQTFAPTTTASSDRLATTGSQFRQIDGGETLKRGFDIVAAGLLLALVLPAFLGIAMLVKCTSSGPVLFRQNRRGLDNTTFRIFKFRTMYHRDRDPDCKAQTQHFDRRVTPVGRVLRRYSLDELPQILNVIIGDMSLVGPRPHSPNTAIGDRLLPEIAPEYLMRYRVKPGITGWAQVNGHRGILETREQLSDRVAHDLYYIQNQTFLFDLQILLKTLPCVTSGAAW